MDHSSPSLPSTIASIPYLILTAACGIRETGPASRTSPHRNPLCSGWFSDKSANLAGKNNCQYHSPQGPGGREASFCALSTRLDANKPLEGGGVRTVFLGLPHPTLDSRSCCNNLAGSWSWCHNFVVSWCNSFLGSWCNSFLGCCCHNFVVC